MAETIRFDVVWGYSSEQLREQALRLAEGPQVYCHFSGYPPLPGERSYAYQRRVYQLVMADSFRAKPSLWQRVKERLSSVSG